ncbi:hypothetical protein Nepgr_024948 [Nepenthes gracilis]|uniref:protein-serine/threonine phosphatase n=1 Tax=Nepenthes gracilis TaxID=150966 RepID=A0AAD3T462_NEPGR|nr:hypothetical protein Nepgr_024948 [Nepenthes gracilis]
MEMVTCCWKPLVHDCEVEEGRRGGDWWLWHKDFGHHVDEEFSMGMIQANSEMEDQCQIELGPLSSLDSGPYGTFIGVYDGHGGPRAAQFVNDKMVHNLKKFVSEHQEISANVMRKAFATTDEDFLAMVKKQWLEKPEIASAGSCCLVGIICNGLLYIANAGDSRVVLGRFNRELAEVEAVQLSNEHNARFESVRKELRLLHPHDSEVVVLKHKVWRVKGVIQITRSIGDAYLKKWEFNREPLLPKYRLQSAFDKPILTADPSITVKMLQPEDRFLIFASDGLWEHLSNQEAICIVRSNPRRGIAKRLIEAALQVAARKREMRYADLKKIDPGVRRHFHDDITAGTTLLNAADNGSHQLKSRKPKEHDMTVQNKTSMQRFIP